MSRLEDEEYRNSQRQQQRASKRARWVAAYNTKDHCRGDDNESDLHDGIAGGAVRAAWTLAKRDELSEHQYGSDGQSEEDPVSEDDVVQQLLVPAGRRQYARPCRLNDDCEPRSPESRV